jgi:hypothetical protein
MIYVYWTSCLLIKMKNVSDLGAHTVLLTDRHDLQQKCATTTTIQFYQNQSNDLQVTRQWKKMSVIILKTARRN